MSIINLKNYWKEFTKKDPNNQNQKIIFLNLKKN